MTPPNLESRVAALEQEVSTLHKLLEQNRIAARIRRGLDQADQGRLSPALEVMETLRKKHNIAPQ